MTKHVKAFREEPYGLFIDLRDGDAAVAVDPSARTVLLNEGEGTDRYHGAVFLPDDEPRFGLEAGDADKGHVVLGFGRRVHDVGETTDVDAARAWVSKANAVLLSLIPIPEARAEDEPDVGGVEDWLATWSPDRPGAAGELRGEVVKG